MKLVQISIFCLTLFLSACDSSSDDTLGALITKPPLMPTTYTFTVDESKDNFLAVAEPFDEIQTDFSADRITVSATEGGVSIKTSEVEKSERGRVDLLKDGHVKALLIVSINNSSSYLDLERAQYLVDNKVDIATQANLDKVFRYFADVAQITGGISEERKEQLLTEFKPTLTPEYHDSIDALNDLEATLTYYHAGGLEIGELKKVTGMAEEAVNHHASILMPELRTLIEEAEGELPELPDIRFGFRKPLGEYTIFKGNPDLGEFDESGAYSYDENYMVLEALLDESGEGDEFFFSLPFWFN